MIKLLLVEDSDQWAGLLKDELEALENYQVSVAYNGNEGLKMWKELSPDIIVTGVDMPMMNGFKMVEQIRQTDTATPVVFATWALAYLSDQRQRDLLAELDGIGSARDLSLVFAEQPVQITGMPVPERPDGRADGPPTALVAYRWRGGTRSEQRLGDMHPHGRWLEWLVQPG